MKKCIKNTAALFAWMLLGLVIGTLIHNLIHEIYLLLYKYMPEQFPLYSAVFDKEEYRKITNTIALISFSLSMISITYIAQRYNNDRFEFIITKTDGLYKIPTVLKIYVYNFGISDLVSSIVCGVFFTLPVCFIPSPFFSSGSVFAEFLNLSKMLSLALGAPGSVLFGVFMLIFSHAVTLVFILKHYRARWLTGFAEGVI